MSASYVAKEVSLYAIIECEGFQFKVSPSQVIRVPRMTAQIGSEVVLDKVLAISDGTNVHVGRPLLSGQGIKAKVVRHGRGEKVVVFRYKRRKDFRKKRGHRSEFTELSIEDFASRVPASAGQER